MNILVAPDSFKDSLPAHEVSRIIAKAISNVIPHATIRQIPISDGGEGSGASSSAADGLHDARYARHACWTASRWRVHDCVAYAWPHRFD